MKSCTKSIKIGHLNVFHLTNKIPDVCNLLNTSTRTHIFGICETKIHASTTNPNDYNDDDDKHFSDLLHIPNYDKPFCRHIKEKLHTGLAVYVHNSIRNIVVRRKDLEPNNIEAIWLEIKQSNSTSKLLGYVYKNPKADTTFYDNFTSMIDSATKVSQNITLLGDFNFNYLKPNEASQQQWCLTTEQLGLHQLINKPTRYDQHYKTYSLLDHIYSKDPQSITNIEVLDSGISDHSPIFCSLTLKLPKTHKNGHTTVEFRSFKNFNETAFLHDVSLIDFQPIYCKNCPDEAFGYLFDSLLPIIDAHAPKKLKRVKNRNLPP